MDFPTVAKQAREAGASLVLDSDTHAPHDILSRDMARKVVEGAGLPKGYLDVLLENSRFLLKKIGYPL